jgi:hypothetical protein
MKLKIFITFRQPRQVVRQFGQAKLIKLANGQHELIGGTEVDRAAAFEWASLIAHAIVFTHYYREAPSPARARKYLFPSRHCLRRELT